MNLPEVIYCTALFYRFPDESPLYKEIFNIVYDKLARVIATLLTLQIGLFQMKHVNISKMSITAQVIALKSFQNYYKYYEL